VVTGAELPLRLAAIAAAVLLTACGSGGTADLPSRTASPPTDRPTVTREAGEPTGESGAERTPERTAERTETEEPDPTEEPEPTREPTSDPTREPTSEPTSEPTREPTREVTREVTVTVQATASAAAAGETGETGDADDGVPPWVWALLAAGLVALILGAWWLQRRNTRQTWEDGLAAATADAEWIVRRLVPDLAGEPAPQQRALAWGAAAQHVGALEEQLAALAAAAPDPQAAARAGALGDAVRQAHGRLDRMLVTEDQTDLTDRLWAVARDLDEAVAATRPAPTP